MTTVTTLALMATVGIGIVEGVDLMDELHFTHAEADAAHEVFETEIGEIKEQIAHQDRRSECRYLSQRIEDLEYQIYELQRDNASQDFIQSKQSELRRHREKFNALNCARLL